MQTILVIDDDEGLRDTIGLCHDAAVASLPDHVRRKAQASITALLKGRA